MKTQPSVTPHKIKELAGRYGREHEMRVAELEAELAVERSRRAISRTVLTICAPIFTTAAIGVAVAGLNIWRAEGLRDIQQQAMTTRLEAIEKALSNADSSRLATNQSITVMQGQIQSLTAITSTQQQSIESVRKDLSVVNEKLADIGAQLRYAQQQPRKP